MKGCRAASMTPRVDGKGASMKARHITLADFEKSKVLRERPRKSREVGRAIAAKADTLPYSRVMPNLECLGEAFNTDESTCPGLKPPRSE
jgi:hypothetical protein